MQDNHRNASKRALQLIGLTKRFGDAPAVDMMDLDVATGEFVTLLGPSGCGKTTTIRMIAGYVDPTAGAVLLGGRDVTHLPPQKRRMGMVFQDYALFPHLTVRDNVAFGPRMQGVGRRERRAAADGKLELVGLAHARDQYPAELSGGMRQRVALARALAIEPEILLLDEPFSALDAKLRTTLRAEVKRIQQVTGITTLLVTHDQQEALGISDRVVVMRAGAVEQVGSPQEVYERPATRFVLDFVGRCATLECRIVDRGQGRISCRVGAATVVAADPGGCAPGDAVTLAVRPENVRLSDVEAGGDPPNGFRGTVGAAEFAGGLEHVTVGVDALGTDVISDVSARGRDGAADRRPGVSVLVSFHPDDVIVLAADGGAADESVASPVASLPDASRS